MTTTKRPRQSPDAEFRHCYGCGRTLPNTREFFYGRGPNIASLSWRCKECDAIRKRTYLDTRREEHRARVRKWHDENREEYNRKKREKYRKNPATRAKVYLNTSNRDARARGAEGSYTPMDIASIYVKQRGCCFYCETDLSEEFHIDHVIPVITGGSNNPDNLVLACSDCNKRKAAMSLDDFVARMQSLIVKGGDIKLRERILVGVTP